MQDQRERETAKEVRSDGKHLAHSRLSNPGGGGGGAVRKGKTKTASGICGVWTGYGWT